MTLKLHLEEAVTDNQQVINSSSTCTRRPLIKLVVTSAGPVLNDDSL